ncbi:hypothetical protein [Sphingobium sp. BS19]|uniref:hypothetical protein n=1 Tax=Sphingobium sp. BS19 TaxID=3018973 RepID=UPI0024910CDC|nr:hypothetical protein [Sphingobium sp. BS19]
MATQPLFETGTDVVPANANTAVAVLFDADKFDAFYAKLKADVEATPVDLTTDKGRKAIASAAAKVRTEKASIDKDRLRLTKEWRDNTAKVNGAWKGIETRMDALAIEARKPLTEWEQAEADRKTKCDAIINRLALDGMVSLDDSAADVRTRGEAVWNTQIDPELFGDQATVAEAAKAHAIATLKTALARLTREEEERAELEKLRAEAAERERAEAAAREKVAREAAEAAEIERQKARVAAEEKAEAERIERAKEMAAQAAQQEVQRKADEARAAMQAEHEKALQAERDRAAEIERAAQVERDRLAKEADEQAKRDRDQKHKTAVMRAAKESIMTCGADEETAKKIVLLIRSGDVPNVTLRF